MTAWRRIKRFFRPRRYVASWCLSIPSAHERGYEVIIMVPNTDKGWEEVVGTLQNAQTGYLRPVWRT